MAETTEKIHGWRIVATRKETEKCGDTEKNRKTAKEPTAVAEDTEGTRFVGSGWMMRLGDEFGSTGLLFGEVAGEGEGRKLRSKGAGGVEEVGGGRIGRVH